MTDRQINEVEKLITIPVNGIAKLIEYKQGIRALLRKIEVGNCDPELMQHVKSVYELLSRLESSHAFSPDQNSTKIILHS
jgi:hypothetical protein